MCGFVTYAVLDAQLIARPPIEEEDLLANVAKYYPSTNVFTLKQAPVFVCGLLTKWEGPGMTADLKYKLTGHLYGCRDSAGTVVGDDERRHWCECLEHLASGVTGTGGSGGGVGLGGLQAVTTKPWLGLLFHPILGLFA